MKTLIIFISFFFIGQSAQACLSAQQTRIFPIGKCDKGLILLETSLFRRNKKGSPEPKMIPAWHGEFRLNIYDEKQNLVHSEILDSNAYIVGETYIKDIKAILDRAERIVIKNFSSGFIPAEFLNITFADYDLKIEGAELVKDTIGMSAILDLEQGSTGDLKLFDNPSKTVQAYVDTYTKWGYEVAEEMQIAAINGLRISSVRTFLIGEETFQIFHLGSGEKIQPWEEGKKREIPKVSVEGQLYDEPVLHHGQGFDFIIWL